MDHAILDLFEVERHTNQLLLCSNFYKYMKMTRISRPSFEDANTASWYLTLACLYTDISLSFVVENEELEAHYDTVDENFNFKDYVARWAIGPRLSSVT